VEKDEFGLWIDHQAVKMKPCIHSYMQLLLSFSFVRRVKCLYQVHVLYFRGSSRLKLQTSLSFSQDALNPASSLTLPNYQCEQDTAGYATANLNSKIVASLPGLHSQFP